jgi:invasion protein IalB
MVMISRPRLVFFAVAIAALVATAGAALAQQDAASRPFGTLAPGKPLRPSPRRRVRIEPGIQPAAPTSASPAQLPNGATSISETYGDWSVNCDIEKGEKICVISQAQGDRQSGQRIFDIELSTPTSGKTVGTILMPFGLKLESGAVLKLDDKDLGRGLRFSTCVPEGCLLPVSFPAIAIDAMNTAKTLTVAALNLSDNNVVSFNVSLNGFAEALDRVAQLGK